MLQENRKKPALLTALLNLMTFPLVNTVDEEETLSLNVLWSVITGGISAKWESSPSTNFRQPNASLSIYLAT